MNNEKVKSNIPKLFVHATGGRNAIFDGIGYKCPLHYHDELEFIVINSGEFVIEHEGDELIAKTGEVIFINSRVPHRTRADIPVSRSLIQFRESDYINGEMTNVLKYSRRFAGILNKPVSILKSETLTESLNDIVDEANNGKRACDLFVKAAIYKVLGTLYRLGILSDADEMLKEKEIQKILPALSYINQHYQENLSLSLISELLNFDESYFCRLFKNATGATFTEYLNFVRICKAESMLAKTQKSILEISEAVGFSSVSYFNRTFKKYRHLAPGAYRSMLYKNI